VNKFNLTFWGEILTGRDPQKVKARFAKMFAIDDPERVEHFFTGDTIILRRNLERKVAAEYYSKLRKLGVESRLVKVEPTAPEQSPATGDNSSEPTSPPGGESEWEQARRLAELEAQQRRAQRAAEREQAKQRAAAAAAQRKAEQQALKRQRAEAEERRKQEEAIRAREQAEAEARRKVELEARRQQQAKEAAERKAAREEARRREEQEAARIKAELDQQKRIAREQAAAEKARKAEEKRKAAEALAKQRALEAEKKRREEQRRKEQAAKDKARRDEEKRKAAEALAKQRALEAEEKRREEQRRKEQAAKDKARRDEEKRKAAEALAKQRALEAEEKRREEQRRKEQAAKDKARRDEEKRKAAEALAKQRALEAEEKRREEQRRKEQAAKDKARRDEEKRKAAEALAKQRALEAEEKRLEEQRRKELAAKEKAEREAEASRLRKEREAAQQAEKAKREAERARTAEQRAKQRAERERKQAEEKRRIEEQRRAEQQREREQEAQRKLMEELAIARAAEELSDMTTLKPAPGKVTTNVEISRGNSLPPKLKRQAGAPNFYSLHPFRNTSEVRERSAIAGRKKFTGLVTAAIALAALMILTGRYLEREIILPASGPSAVAAAPSGALAMLAGNTLLLHDRAGVGSESIALADSGIPGAVTPFAYNTSGELLLHASPNSGADNFTQLHRCNADFTDCDPVPVEGHAQAMTTHPLTGEIFLAGMDRLVKLSPQGKLLAETELALPDRPVILLDSGLLFINSRDGPAISVYRYENSAFGEQLDEILLLPPPAVAEEQTRARDFVRAGTYWWVRLENPETRSAGFYLFDSDWNYQGEANAGEGWEQAHMLAWGQKVLLWKDSAATLKRFSAEGQPEAALQSDLLTSFIARQQRNTQLANLAWAASFSLFAAIAAIGAMLGYHQYLRSMVYHSRPTRGAESLDELIANIHWIDPAAGHQAAIKRLWLSYSVVAAAIIMVCIGLGVNLTQLAAALIALSGPAIALILFQRSEPAHVGTLEEQLILVDHRQMYHAASGHRIQHRGPFLLIDDVVVFVGSNALPALSMEQFAATVAPVVNKGTRVDRKTVLVKLLDSGHPLARGVTIIGGAFLSAFIILVAGQFL
jgi:hypothetical protein